MTRKEALKKIKDFNDYLDPNDDRPFEEQILSFFEDVLKMLPQCTKTNEYNHWIDHKGGTYCQNTWED